MSRKALVLVLALVAVVLLWPVAGAVSAADGSVGGDALANLTPGDDTPGNGADDAPPDAPGLSVAEEKKSQHSDDDGQPLTVGIVDGTLGPGETVTIEVSQGNETVENVTVEVNEEPVGVTDADGILTFTLSDDDKTKIKIEHDDAETELEFEFEGGDDEDEEDAEDDEEEDEREDEDDEDEEGEEDEREDEEDEEDEREDEEDEEDEREDEEDEEDEEEEEEEDEEDNDGDGPEDGEDHPGGGKGPF